MDENSPGEEEVPNVVGRIFDEGWGIVFAESPPREVSENENLAIVGRGVFVRIFGFEDCEFVK
ncbi:hypothetical protein N7475_001782 [Penicillium sp. IBT 31633x]|nr:hypothetical protein N7475_001782 [Penicillium sp. IBT 31633x]